MAFPLHFQMICDSSEVYGNPAAHADDHRLAVHRFQPPLEVLDKVFRDQANPFLAADECFQRGPLGLELLLAILFFPFGDFLELGIDLGQFGFVQAQLGDAAFVVDRDRGLVDDRLLDVVDRDVLAEHGPRVDVVLLDGRAGEADERGVRQGVAHVAGEVVGLLAGLFIQLADAPVTPRSLG